MKRLFLLTALATLSACDKNEERNATSEILNSEIEVITTDINFMQIKYDSAYVSTFESQLKELSAKEGLTMPDVDFSKNAVIVVTGIAPDKISKIAPSLYKKNGRQYLDFNIDVTDSEGMNHPQKWNIMLKAPLDTDPQIECRIKYDREFSPDMHAPINQIYLGSTYIENSLYKVDIEPYNNTYLIEIAALDSSLFLSHINNTNIIHKRKYDANQGWNNQTGEIVSNNGFENPYFIFGNIKEPKAELLHLIVENCDYETVLAPLKNKIVFCSKIFDYAKTTKVSATYYSGLAAIHPKLYLSYNGKEIGNSGQHDKLKYLAHSANAEYQEGAIILHSNSKVNYFQMQELIIDNGIEVTFSPNSCCNMLRFLPLPE